MDLIEAFIAVALAMLGLYSLVRGMRPGAGNHGHRDASTARGCEHGTCEGCTGTLVQLTPPASSSAPGRGGNAGHADAAPHHTV